MLLLGSFILLGALLYPGTEGGSLLRRRTDSRKGVECCKGLYIKSCNQTDLNVSALGKRNLFLEPLKAKLKYKGMVGDSKNSFHYANANVDLTLTLDKKTSGAYGRAVLNDGRTYVLSFCGGVHIFKEIDIQEMYKVQESSLDVLNQGRAKGISVYSSSQRHRTVSKTRSSRSSITTFTVKVYFTQQFLKKGESIWGFISDQENRANDGYKNSDVPLRVKVIKAEMATIGEISGSDVDQLRNFVFMKDSVEKLRDGADATILFVSDKVSWPGIASGIDTLNSGVTVSTCRRTELETSYCFAHELGHSIGLAHNWDFIQGSTIHNPNDHKFINGHGYLMDLSKYSPGMGSNTIMAYPGFKDGINYTPINFYSNPKKTTLKNKVPYGVAGQTDNAKILTNQRYKLSFVGYQSSKCIIADAKIGISNVPIRNIWSVFKCKNNCLNDKYCVAWTYNYYTSWYFWYTIPCTHTRRIHVRNNSYQSGPGFYPKCMKKETSCWNSYSRARMVYKEAVLKGDDWVFKVGTASTCDNACYYSKHCTLWTYDKKTKKCRHITMGSQSSYAQSGSGYC